MGLLEAIGEKIVRKYESLDKKTRVSIWIWVPALIISIVARDLVPFPGGGGLVTLGYVLVTWVFPSVFSVPLLAILYLLKREQGILIGFFISFLWNIMLSWVHIVVGATTKFGVWRSDIYLSLIILLNLLPPLFICYIYQKRGIFELKWGGYLGAAILPLASLTWPLVYLIIRFLGGL